MQKIDINNVEKQALKELYEIEPSKQAKHLIIKAMCESPELEKGFHD